ncbi:MAG: hypothetical protein ABJF50_05235 [Paracoccaceae bacterium]
MIRRIGFLALFALSACAVQEEVIMAEEPMIEEDLAAVRSDECDIGDDDGIGGTGCEPVARRSTEP